MNIKKGKYFHLAMLFFFAVTASFAVWSGAFFMGVTPRVEHIITWCFIVYAVYGINRYTDVEDYLNDSEKRSFFLDHKKYLYLAVSLLVISTLWLLISGLLTAYHIICTYAGIAYSIPIFPGISGKYTVKWVRLKEIPVVKNLLVSLILGTSFFAIYIFDSKIENYPDIIALIVGSSLTAFFNTLFCDVRDAVGDKAAGIKTIPTIYGIKQTIRKGIFLPSILWSTLLIVLLLNSILSLSIAVFLLLMAAYPVLYIYLYKLKFSNKITFFVADACIPIYAIGLIILKIISFSPIHRA